MPYLPVGKTSVFGLPQIFTIPGTAATGFWTVPRVVGAIGASALAGATAVSLYGGKGQQVAQEAKLNQTGSALAEPHYQIDVKPGGTANLYGAGGQPTVTQSGAIDQKAEQISKPTDYVGLIILGAVAIGGLLLVSKLGKK